MKSSLYMHGTCTGQEHPGPRKEDSGNDKERAQTFAQLDFCVSVSGSVVNEGHDPSVRNKKLKERKGAKNTHQNTSD